ncbi:MAG: hypothetical protein HC840_21475 [Leptolyngbyaceae cyanobacterium RM2_2_4]|nr:hypothetical protein [Leptolyngbyaceae cyanobacterium SM1_4_3]NJO51568.1 hypothetical protein [Leptolyngbyaceae cyanobacterium RM2_2_4]
MNFRKGERPFALTGDTGTGKSSLYSATPLIFIPQEWELNKIEFVALVDTVLDVLSVSRNASSLKINGLRCANTAYSRIRSY